VTVSLGQSADQSMASLLLIAEPPFVYANRDDVRQSLLIRRVSQIGPDQRRKAVTVEKHKIVGTKLRSA
jgi:hypothetical protein